MMSVLEEARTTVEQAMAKLDEDAGALYYEDGRPAHADPERRLQQLRDRATGRVEAALEVVDRTISEAKTAIERGDVEPVSNLSTDELSRAASLRAFIQEDASAFTLDQVVNACASALQGTDRAEMALWYRYGGQRAEREMGNGNDPNSAGRTAALRALLRQLGDRLGTPALAPERLRDAQALRRYLQQQHRKATGAQAEAQRALISSGKYPGF